VSVGKVVWVLFLEERDKLEEIWVDLSTRLVSDVQKPGSPVERLSTDSSFITDKEKYTSKKVELDIFWIAMDRNMM